ncbi:hypothetical protein [Burkholderia multivorans]|uniref:hypothetical protein n=2 Tax=Burkholderia multivorans TaxID=87883 RepID=UPI001C21FFD0|nr:hypothetical protein [Burkholderia multivorans]MBU9475586.1 hypothetical protein [Burkholderia multivorans]
MKLLVLIRGIGKFYVQCRRASRRTIGRLAGCIRGDSAVGASRFARPFGARIALIVDGGPRAMAPQTEHVGAACLADPGDVAADGVANDGIERAVFRFGNPRQFGDDRCRQID